MAGAECRRAGARCRFPSVPRRWHPGRPAGRSWRCLPAGDAAAADRLATRRPRVSPTPTGERAFTTAFPATWLGNTTGAGRPAVGLRPGQRAGGRRRRGGRRPPGRGDRRPCAPTRPCRRRRRSRMDVRLRACAKTAVAVAVRRARGRPDPAARCCAVGVLAAPGRAAAVDPYALSRISGLQYAHGEHKDASMTSPSPLPGSVQSLQLGTLHAMRPPTTASSDRDPGAGLAGALPGSTPSRPRKKQRNAVLAHNYQAPEIFPHRRRHHRRLVCPGVSWPRAPAPTWIVLCGVHFMAETAKVSIRQDRADS